MDDQELLNEAAKVEEYLVSKAQEGVTDIDMQTFARLFGAVESDKQFSHFNKKIFPIMNQIRRERDSNLPLLSSIVVTEDGGSDDGIYKQALAVGKIDASDERRLTPNGMREIVKNLQKDVVNYYKKK